jgi:hypothetical protein
MCSQMNSFIVHISDARGLDAQAAVTVEDSMDLGRAAQVALDALMEAHGHQLAFPIFVDIHPRAEFQDREWMHPGSTFETQDAVQN